jgi:hypothetical protein
VCGRSPNRSSNLSFSLLIRVGAILYAAERASILTDDIGYGVPPQFQSPRPSLASFPRRNGAQRTTMAEPGRRHCTQSSCHRRSGRPRVTIIALCCIGGIATVTRTASAQRVVSAVSRPITTASVGSSFDSMHACTHTHPSKPSIYQYYNY